MNQALDRPSYRVHTGITWGILIGVLIVVVAILHYTTPVHLRHLHELYRAFFYLPIILAAFRFQLKGGLTSSISVIILYLPHVVFQWGGDFLSNFSRFLEMAMYLLIGWVAGILAQRELKERQKYQNAAAELEQSYRQLKIQSEKLSEIEEQLRVSERLSILGELSASLAHEVRNPLGSIWGAVEILQDKLKKQGEDSEFTELLLQEVKRLNQVVENYLSLARKTPLMLQSCNLQEVVQSVIHLLTVKARKQGINLQRKFPKQPIFIEADENQLRQILINLILNAMAAIAASGTITIKAELTPDRLSPDNKRPPETVHLSIIDTGPGMEPQIIQQIFKPFFTTRQDGTGLGLNIVKRIVEQNKWKIQVDSKPGHGTTMTIILPLEGV